MNRLLFTLTVLVLMASAGEFCTTLELNALLNYLIDSFLSFAPSLLNNAMQFMHFIAAEIESNQTKLLHV